MRNSILRKMSGALGAAALFGMSCNAFAYADLNGLQNLSDYANVWEYHTLGFIGGFGGSDFNDQSPLSQHNPWIKPTKIRVRADERVDKISIDYGYSSAATVPLYTSSHGGGGGSESTIYLSDDEFIERATVCSTDSVTSKGKIGRIKIFTTHEQHTYGSTCNSVKDFMTPAGWHIIGFKGRSGDEVDQLVAIVAPKVKMSTTVVMGELTNLENLRILSQGRMTAVNNSSVTQPQSQDYSTTQGNSYSTNWSNTVKFSLGFTLAQSVTAGVTDGPFTASSTISSSVTTEFAESFQHGASNTLDEMTTLSQTFNFIVPPRAIIVGDIDRTVADATGALHIYYTNLYTGTVHKSEGTVSRFSSTNSRVIQHEIGSIGLDGFVTLNAVYENAPNFACYKDKHIIQVNSCNF